MKNLFKSYEIAERFKIPKQTALNWSREKDTWRKGLYTYLEQCYAKELAELAKQMEKEANDGV